MACCDTCIEILDYLKSEREGLKRELKQYEEACWRISKERSGWQEQNSRNKAEKEKFKSAWIKLRAELLKQSAETFRKGTVPAAHKATGFTLSVNYMDAIADDLELELS